MPVTVRSGGCRCRGGDDSRRTRRRRCGGPAGGSGGARLGGRGTDGARGGGGADRRRQRVPGADSDTGTNVLLTVVGGADAVALVPADAAAADVGAGVRAWRPAVGARQLRRHRQPVPDRLRSRAARAGRTHPRSHAPGAGGPGGPRGDRGAAGGHGPHAGRRRRGRAATAADAGADLATMLGSASRTPCAASGGSAPCTPCCAPRACWTPAPAPCWSSWTRWPAWSATSGRSRRPARLAARRRRAPPWPVEPPAARTRSCCWSATTARATALRRHRPELRRRWGAGRLGGRRRRGRQLARARPHRPSRRRDRRRGLGRASRSSSASSPGRTRRVGATTGDVGSAGVSWCAPRAGPGRLYAAAGAVVLVRCPEAPIRAEHLERAVTDTGAAHVALLPGTGAEVATAPSRPGRGRRDARRGRRGARRRRRRSRWPARGRRRRVAPLRRRRWPGCGVARRRGRVACTPCPTRSTRSCGRLGRPPPRA